MLLAEPSSPASTTATEVQEAAGSMTSTEVDMDVDITAESYLPRASVRVEPLAVMAVLPVPPHAAYTGMQTAPEAIAVLDGHAAGAPASPMAGQDPSAHVPQRQPRRRPVRRDPVVTEAMAKTVAGAQKPGPITRAQRAMAEHMERMQTRAAHTKSSTASGVPVRPTATATNGVAGKRGPAEKGPVQKTGACGRIGAARRSCRSGDVGSSCRIMDHIWWTKLHGAYGYG